MKRIPVDSSNLVSVGYEPSTRTLEIEFKGGAVYQYPNIDPKLYKGLISAESKGKFFNFFIRSLPAVRVS